MILIADMDSLGSLHVMGQIVINSDLEFYDLDQLFCIFF